MIKVKLQDLRLDSRYKKLKSLSGKEFSYIKKFIAMAKNGENSSGIDISELTERKYIDTFIMAYKSVKKPLLQLTKDDLTKLKHDLRSGKIKTRCKKPYAISSQKNMEMTLICFLEFVKPKKYSGFRKWFIVKIPKKDVDYLREEEVEKLYKSAKSNGERFLMAVLFDTGARASEFLNIRAEDITEPTSSFPYYKINFKEEYSKTKGRNIGLYWKHSTEAVRDFLKERGELKEKEPVYNKTYNSIRIFLTRLGQRVLSKRIYFHLFRKASASYYAIKLKSRQQLCYRYGWTFSSSVPDVYITRQLGEEEVKSEMVNIDLQKVQKENSELKTIVSINEEKSQKDIDNLRTLVLQFARGEISYNKETGEFWELGGKKGLVKIPMRL